MSEIKNNLRFLELSKDFAVKQLENGDYEITFECREDYDIVAFIDTNGEVEYCVSDCYDCGQNYITIDIEQLKKMMEFVKLLKDKK